MPMSSTRHPGVTARSIASRYFSLRPRSASMSQCHPEICRLRVRVGTFARADNARRARLITEEIHHQLGLDPPDFDALEAEQPEIAEPDPEPEIAAATS